MREKKIKIDYSLVIDFSIRKMGYDVALEKLKGAVKKKVAIHPIDSDKIQGSIGVDYKSKEEAIEMAKTLKKRFLFVSKIKIVQYLYGNEVLTKTIK